MKAFKAQTQDLLPVTVETSFFFLEPRDEKNPVTFHEILAL